MRKFLIPLIAAATVLLASPTVHATENVQEGVCQPQSGHIQGGSTSVTVTAPEGKVITGYCVKAGSIHQGNGPEYVSVNNLTQVTITHSSGKTISHYVVFYTNKPVVTTTTTTTTEAPPSTTTTTTEVVDTTSTTSAPTSSTSTTSPATTSTVAESTTTSSPSPTTSPSTTLPDTTSTVAVTTPPVPSSTISTTVAPVVTTATTAVQNRNLPETGAGTGLLALGALGLILIGGGVTAAARRK